MSADPLGTEGVEHWGWVGVEGSADALRYLVATKSRAVLQRKLAGV